VDTLRKRLDGDERVLLIDTCGETAGVALFGGQRVIAAEDLAQGRASAEIVSVVRRLLGQAGWRVQELCAVGVVRGPGSFTGIRAGLAVAKGLCEAAGVPLVAVSRLEVLADVASLRSGFAVLDAGRGEVYVREVSTQREWLSLIADFETACAGQPVAIADARLVERLLRCSPVVCPLHVADALAAVLRTLRAGGSDGVLADANYVREESDIYRKPEMAAKVVRGLG
jgi:tRNA threonylcarbamoyladenosine biosynthesis protein TsaB